MQVSQRKLLIVCFCALLSSAQAQQSELIVSGPMLGQVELRTALIWIELSPRVKTASIRYWKKSEPQQISQQDFNGVLGREFNPVKFIIGGLEFNTSYSYDFMLNGKPSSLKGDFTTKDL